MVIGSELEQMARLVGGEGESCDLGCAIEDIPRMISISKKLCPIKPYRVVRQWCWADLEVTMTEMDEFTQAGFKPSFLYVGEIIEDERGEFRKGNSVKTTFLTEFHLDCLFITKNTTYILVGPGKRMTVQISVYLNLFF